MDRGEKYSESGVAGRGVAPLGTTENFKGREGEEKGPAKRLILCKNLA